MGLIMHSEKPATAAPDGVLPCQGDKIEEFEEMQEEGHENRIDV
jgi:hypothetical protein